MTFLCIIHENPNSFGKARGHLGTELINKASTVFQISLEKTDNDTPSDIINVKYLKNRSTKRLSGIYFRCNEETQLLELVDENDIKAKSKKTTRKADESEVISYLEQLTWQSAFSKNDLCNHLKAQFNVSDETLINRLKVIEQEKYTILNENSETCHLFSFTKGKEKYFEIRLSESIA